MAKNVKTFNEFFDFKEEEIKDDKKWGDEEEKFPTFEEETEEEEVKEEECETCDETEKSDDELEQEIDKEFEGVLSFEMFHEKKKEEKEEEEEEEEVEEKEPKKGLTTAQKKLPKGLQDAILKKQK